MDLPVLRTHQSSRLLIAFSIPGIIIIITFLLLTIRYVSHYHFVKDVKDGVKKKKGKITHQLSSLLLFFFIEEFLKKEFNVQKCATGYMYIYIYVKIMKRRYRV